MARQRPEQIGYVDQTWNPIAGCSPVGEGCRNCWAARMAATRLNSDGVLTGKQGPYLGFAEMCAGKPRWTGRVELRESALKIPLHWRKPRRIAVGLMADWMHPNLPDETRDRILAVEALCPGHVFIHLTKRWKEQAEYLSHVSTPCHIKALAPDLLQWPLPNLTIGNSAWNQPSADEACKWLLQTPAACRLLCLEPLLGEVDLKHLQPNGEVEIDALEGTHGVLRPHAGRNERLGWVIVSPETGPGRRPCEWSWIRAIVQQCRVAGVPVWVKALLDSRGRKLPFEQWPQDLRVRELPEVKHG